jgi:hypothetical protein
MPDERKGGGRLNPVTSIRGGVNTTYQIPQQQRPPDPPPMKAGPATNLPPPAPKTD